jgi:hypothetical protein
MPDARAGQSGSRDLAWRNQATGPAEAASAGSGNGTPECAPLGARIAHRQRHGRTLARKGEKSPASRTPWIASEGRGSSPLSSTKLVGQRPCPSPRQRAQAWPFGHFTLLGPMQVSRARPSSSVGRSSAADVAGRRGPRRRRPPRRRCGCRPASIKVLSASNVRKWGTTLATSHRQLSSRRVIRGHARACRTYGSRVSTSTRRTR